MGSRILDELEAAFGQELALVGDDLGALETAVQGKLRQLGQGLLRRLLAREDRDRVVIIDYLLGNVIK